MLAIAADCDFVVENFRPGIHARLGCDYESIGAVRADIVYCSISGFGQTGPSLRPAYDIITQGMTGFLSMTGHAGGPPAKIGIAINDIAATTAVQAILAAHIARLNGAGGQYIDLSLVESGLAWTVWEAAGFFGAGDVPTQVGARHRRSTPYQAYRTADGYVTLGANTERMWLGAVHRRARPPRVGRGPAVRRRCPTAWTIIDELEREIEAITMTTLPTSRVDRRARRGRRARRPGTHLRRGTRPTRTCRRAG